MTTQADLDGIPVLLAPARGPLRAGLAFRVGQADETLSTHGITHLVEHLALHGHGVTDYHVNGETAATMTQFVAAGDADEIASYLSGVCTALADLPLGRIDVEKAILRVEASNRARGPFQQMPLWRHGARDFGLLSYPEFGLNRIGADDVTAWSRQWFTRENAVLWITADAIPAGIKIDLPSSEPAAFPEPSSALPSTPAYYFGPSGFIAAEMQVKRSVAATAYSVLLQRVLHRQLRQEDGLSYSTEAGYLPRSRDLAQVLAFADAVPDSATAAAQRFVTVLQGLARGEIRDEDFAATIKSYQDGVRRPDNDANRLASAAFDHFTGYRHRSSAEIEAEIAGLTIADVHAAAVEAVQSALVMTPEGRGLEWAGFDPAPHLSRFAVRGSSYRSRANPDARLLVADDGISFVDSSGPTTVLFEHCEALLAFPDGGRRLFGCDGIAVAVEPTLFALPPAMITRIDAAVDATRHVTMAARPEGEIPAVTLAGRSRAYSSAMRIRRIRRKAGRQAKARSRSLFHPGNRGRAFGIVAVVAIPLAGFTYALEAGQPGLIGPLAMVSIATAVRASRRKR